MDRLHRPGHDGEQFATKGIQVDLLAQPPIERIDHRVNVIPGAVETAVDGALDARARRLERACHSEC